MDANDRPIATPRTELCLFLREKRERLEPGAVGLPRRSARGGLTREDVAELLDVSALWYGLFESGTSRRRFSGRFLDKVARTLRLDAAERERLVRLVVAGGNAAPDVEASWYRDRWQRTLDEVTAAIAALTDADSRRGAQRTAGALQAIGERAVGLTARESIAAIATAPRSGSRSYPPRLGAAGSAPR